MVDLLFATGMRVAEVSTLKSSDFLDKEVVFKVQGKVDRDRLAFIVNSETVRIQRAHAAARVKFKPKAQRCLLFIHGRLSTQGTAT
jgi:site-specific recombinase XerD